MDYKNFVLKDDEKAIFELRALYGKYGYTQYKMSKFEEYDLYVKNKSFLISENILTFTDTNGKLMALKPDVTLSIIKNTKDDETGLQKVYYNENVYRVSGTAHEFKEIMQTGLECVGDIDLYAIGEVIMLAARSLEKISPDYILDISHMGFLAGILDETDFDEVEKAELLHFISEKNMPAVRRMCADSGVASATSDKLCMLASLYGPVGEMLPKLKEMSINAKTEAAAKELEDIYGLICVYGFEKHVNLDFSVVNDMKYYSGVIFQGFINGIPSGVLSGGRYDNLLHMLGKKSGAIGFAVYLDLLERLNADEKEYDVDVLLLYDTTSDIKSVTKKAEELTAAGKSVKAAHTTPDKLRYKELVKI